MKEERSQEAAGGRPAVNREFDAAAQRKANRKGMMNLILLIVSLAALAVVLYCGCVVFSPAR
jgi:hypothetical protein